MKLSGHWFCDHCDDVVVLPMPLSRPVANEACPVCHCQTARFVLQAQSLPVVTESKAEKLKPEPLLPPSPTTHALFESMRSVVNQASDPTPKTN